MDISERVVYTHQVLVKPPLLAHCSATHVASFGCSRSASKTRANCLVIIGLVISGVLWQTPGWSQTTGLRTSVSNSRYLSRPLPDDVTTLGPGFVGHDIRAVVASMVNSGSSRPKSEFETTAQYEARVRAALEQTHPLVFVLKPASDLNGDVFSYDADNQVLSARIRPAAFPFTTTKWNGLEVRRDLISTSQYAASNAFGVRTLVTRRIYKQFGILFSVGNGIFEKDILKFPSEFQARLEFSMKAPEAADVKPYLRVALVCRVSDPKVLQEVSKGGATISSPLEIVDLQHLIVTRPDRLLVFDQRSGRILGSLVGDSSTGAVTRTELSRSKFPLRLQMSSPQFMSLRIRIDDDSPKKAYVDKDGVVYARKRIEVVLEFPGEQLSSLTFKLNGAHFKPNWIVDRSSITNTVESASFWIDESGNTSNDLVGDRSKLDQANALPVEANSPDVSAPLIEGRVFAPVRIFKVEPEYSAEALKAKFQGTVLLEIVVDTDGTTRDIRVIRAARHGAGQEGR